MKFVRNQPDVQVIRFTQPGSVDGGGGWSANAVVTIGGKEYHEILGPNTLGGDPLPDTPAGATSGPVLVQYSDGTSEVLE
ncbi:hypothetical protein J2W45_002116 [Leifsonia shinshuensis]|nr:hypothetical protein [Leifsonia shinshuensis]